MCGIVGAVAKRNVVPILLEGLKRLEYRGYDSAGMAVLNGGTERALLRRLRSTGRVAELERLSQAEGLAGETGIAHTRWATHGVPSEKNAHPHVSGGGSGGESPGGAEGLAGETGIAHTRWATHGVPSEKNAHPHVSGGVSVVHNGIIENHEELRARLRAGGYEFVSDTDTEVIAHLVHSNLQSGASLFDAVRKSVAELVGAYAIAVVSENHPSSL